LDPSNKRLITITGNVLTNGTLGSIPRNNPITTFFYTVISAENIQITSNVFVLRLTFDKTHLLHINDRVQINGIQTIPNFYNSTTGILPVYAVPSSNQIDLNFHATSIDPLSIANGNVFVGTGLLNISFPKHGFNVIVSIQTGTSVGTIQFTTLLNHNFINSSFVTLSKTQGYYNSDPFPNVAYKNLDGHYQITVIDNTNFTISFTDPLDHVGSPQIGTYLGIFGLSDNIFLYGANSINGILDTNINSISLPIREIFDENTFVVLSPNVFSSNNSITFGGGSNIFISSEKNGFNGVQNNTKNNLLNRSINLEGANYVFLCSPQLPVLLNTGPVADIFTKITLHQGSGAVLFNSALDIAKIFEDTPLASLSSLEFSVRNYNNTLFEFNDLDYSFSLLITETIDNLSDAGYSSRRGITDTAQFNSNTGFMKPI
jgi:hypothetical protein